MRVIYAVPVVAGVLAVLFVQQREAEIRAAYPIPWTHAELVAQYGESGGSYPDRDGPSGTTPIGWWYHDRDQAVASLSTAERNFFSPQRALRKRALALFPFVTVILGGIAGGAAVVAGYRRRRRPPSYTVIDPDATQAHPIAGLHHGPVDAMAEFVPPAPPVAPLDGSLIGNMMARTEARDRAATDRTFLQEACKTLDMQAETYGAMHRVVAAKQDFENADLETAVRRQELINQHDRLLSEHRELNGAGPDPQTKAKDAAMRYLADAADEVAALGFIAERFGKQFGPSVGARLFETVLDDYRAWKKNRKRGGGK